MIFAPEWSGGVIVANKFKSSARLIPIHEAVGSVLAHDITEIRPGEFKGVAFKKGHIVREEDIPHLRRLGKEHLFALEIEPHEVHEDDAAIRLAEALSGPGIKPDGIPSEGKISLKTSMRGLFKVNVPALTELCMIPEICCSSRHGNIPVEKGETVVSLRAIPLVIDEKILLSAIDIIKKSSPIFMVKQFSNPPTGIIVTGNEVYAGLIQDKFASILKKKLSHYECPITKVIYCPDDVRHITRAIDELINTGSSMILVSGGMSVDPDDVSRIAIENAGASDIIYGTSVLPGAMFLYARIGSVPIMGLPACVLYFKATVFDLILPRVLAREKITRVDLAQMAHGGLCLNCPQCRFPICPFGK